MTEVDDEQRGQCSQWCECSELSADYEWRMKASDISNEGDGVEEDCTIIPELDQIMETRDRVEMRRTDSE